MRTTLAIATIAAFASIAAVQAQEETASGTVAEPIVINCSEKLNQPIAHPTANGDTTVTPINTEQKFCVDHNAIAEDPIFVGSN